MSSFSFNRLIIILALAISLIWVAGCSGGGGSKITISTLTVAPVRLAAGQTVTIAANVLNSGAKSEDYTAILKINQAAVDNQTLTLAAGETRTLSFQYIPQTPGTYQIDLNGQTASFEAIRPAAFTAGTLKVSPASPVLGDELTVSFNVTNTGDIGDNYTAQLKVDGTEIKSNVVRIEAGATQSATIKFNVETSGSHIVEMGGLSQEIKVLKPAVFKGTAVTITPVSALPGENVTIEAMITNEGDVQATRDVELLLNGNKSGYKTLSLEPGAADKVNYVTTKSDSGTYNVNVLGATGSFKVVILSKYSSQNYFYSIAYPPEFEIDDEEPAYAFIRNDNYEGISVYVEKVSTLQTMKENFAVIMQNNEEYNDNWTMSNQIPISSGSSGSGYKFDYSFTSDEEKYSGSGLVLKSAGLSYEVEFSTLEQDWPRYKSVAGQCLDSFTPPPSFSGAYSNAALGLALTLPAEWSVTETGIASAPLLFSSPFNQPEIRGALSIESVPAGTTAQQYLKSALQIITTALGSASGNGTDFTYSDGTIGYTQQMSGSQPTGAAYSFQMWDQIKNGRGITLMFAGMGEAVSSQTGPITQMVRSLVVSQPGGIAGVDRNNAIIMLEGEIPTLDPALVESGPGDIVGAIFSGLVRIDTDLKIAPDLAESWKVSPDGLTYTFILRPNAQFHNGQPVTAGDVKYSWERACDPLLKSPKAKSFLADIVGARDRLAGTASDIGGIKVIDDHTLEVTIDAARPYFLSELAQPVAFIVDKNDVISSQMLKTQPNGTGPFKVKTWQKDSLMVLERNDNFYLAPAKVKNLVFKLYAGDPMQLYESGEIDLAPVSISNQDRVLDQTNPLNKELVSGSSYDIYAIGFNVTKAPLDDIKIRQALVMALDASKLIDVTFKGRAERAAGFVPPGIPGNNPDLKPAVFDLAKAKQLIQESKYGSPDKVPEITIYVPYAVGPIDQAIIGMWQTLGLKVSSQVVNNLDDYRTRLNNKEFQVYEPSWRADYIDPQNFLEIFFQSQSPENGFAYNNPEVDAALAKAGKEQDPAVRLKMYQDIEKIVLADLPASPLWWKTKTYFLVKPYVKGYAVYPIDINIWRDLSVLPH